MTLSSFDYTPSTVVSSLISCDTTLTTPTTPTDFEGQETNIISLGLQLPGSTISDKKRVVLLCRDAIYIDEKKVTSDLQVTKVLFETPPTSGNAKHVIVFQCKTENRSVCLKLINDNEIFRVEKKAYDDMLNQGNGVTRLFLKVYFFFEVMMPDNRVWKGYCMDVGQYSLRDIIHIQATSSLSCEQEMEHKQIFKEILKDKEKALSSPQAEVGGGGEPVIFIQTQSIQMSIALAALRLLHRMHAECGWVHGDSHMGNFMYLNQNIYAIDFERSFGSSNHVQHLMDIQEFFGHFSGILLNAVRANDWDMRDISGLYYYRHPLVSGELQQAKQQKIDQYLLSKNSNFSRRKTLFMLPICSCFTCPTDDLRLKGCGFCKSHLNVQSAEFVASHFEEVLEDMSEWGLSKMKTGLQHTRQTSMMKQCSGVAEVIYPCIKDGSIFTMRINAEGEFVAGKKRGKRMLVEIDEKTSMLNSRLVSELTQSKQSCASVLKRLLYMPLVNEKANNIVREIVKRLNGAGYTDAANTLSTNVAATC